ncbi:hypothetical protein H9P43_010103 [Blastocladiella emersonii ATCC 22665]|nr:hypothetical protein H9P43_010103 [Blastocladiella emersonii ATCC 22665]
MPPYLLHFAQAHEDFRRPEIDALAALEGVALTWVDYDPACPFATVDLASDAAAAALVRRSILVKHAYALWDAADDYDALHAAVRANPGNRNAPFMDASFKFVVETFNTTKSMPEKVAIINSFAYMAFRGVIDLKTPDATLGVLEAWTPPHDPDHRMTRVYFGLLVATGDRRAIDRYNLKRRAYLGTTSMDPELSLIMANMAHVKPGALVYDPFVGTGSFLVTAAHFGGVTVGSDIDGRQIRGTGKGSARSTDAPGSVSVHSNIAQYGCADRVLDCLVFDLAHHPWRNARPFLDAIVTDPPYGVRAGAKKIGGEKWRPAGVSPDASRKHAPSHGQGRFPATVPYDLDAVMADLTDFAARSLVVGGRLSYWLPTVKAEYAPEDVPLHPALRLVANSEQPFGQWSRRLITIEKVRDWEPGMHVSGSGLLGAKLESMGSAALDAFSSANSSDPATTVASTKKPGHKGFRESYFNFGADNNRRDP